MPVFPAAQLDELLSEDVSAAVERERSAFEAAAGPQATSLVLFGAGQLGRRTLAGLRKIGIEPLAFADNNQALWGKRVHDLAVLSPADAASRHGDGAAFVVCIWGALGQDRMGTRIRQLEELGCRRVIPFAHLYWSRPDVFLPHYAVDLPHRVLEQADDVRAGFALLADDASRAEFIAQLRWRLRLDFAGLPDPSPQEIYFPPDLFTLSDREVFVDCGAYDGDTLRRLLHHRDGKLERVEAFEPDPGNFRKLTEWVGTLPEDVGRRFHLHQNAVGAERGTVRFSAFSNEASFVGSGELEVECVALDETLDGVAPTYLKMDIEGSELSALAGCRATVAAARPAMAICAYHVQDHMWRIPLAIAGSAGDYRFHLRSYLLEAWDLVCYAVPRDRSSG